ncbi:MAG TPA: hypothetical protein VMW49_01250 [Candidatus Dormibacteraeota bacterium]|nr:hypothetical protein [Candidatus Dormibacteraeota bacterium]
MPAATPLTTAERRLRHSLRALPDQALDRARAHLAAGLPMRRADLGWRGGDRPAHDGCLVGVSMSRRQLLLSPLRTPRLMRLAARFDAWVFAEAQRLEDWPALRNRQLPAGARDHLGQLLDWEYRRRHPLRTGAGARAAAAETGDRAPTGARGRP